MGIFVSLEVAAVEVRMVRLQAGEAYATVLLAVVGVVLCGMTCRAKDCGRVAPRVFAGTEKWTWWEQEGRDLVGGCVRAVDVVFGKLGDGAALEVVRVVLGGELCHETLG